MQLEWREWGEAAFQEARTLDRPILLSISAVWCHWCHVMDRGTYTDPEVVDLVGREFVPVRVDNDARPEVNARYNMGGWPTTAFLTPEGDILTGATYLPPEQMLAALRQVAAAYATQKPQIAAAVLRHRKHAPPAATGAVAPDHVDAVLEWLESAYDPDHGGFGGAPKFPMTDALCLLLEQEAVRQEPRWGEMARHTLRQMAAGGTYDHVEGGFFRYSTTEDWSVPHFEKMLEDHGGLVYALALAGLGDVLDRATGYLDTVLRDPKTGLYGGSQDADEEYYRQGADGRRARPAPFVDRRVYAGWNCGLAVAYLQADRLLGRPQLRRHAEQALDRLFAERLSAEGDLRHLPGSEALLGDQAYGLWAACRTGRLETARLLAERLEERFGEAGGGYRDHPGSDRLGRLGEPALPLHENSVAAIALLELDALEGDPAGPWRERARGALEVAAGAHRQHGIMAAVYARAADRYLRPAVKVTTGSMELAAAAVRADPYAVVEPDGEGAVVCVGNECYAPTGSATEVAALARRAFAQEPVEQ